MAGAAGFLFILWRTARVNNLSVSARLGGGSLPHRSELRLAVAGAAGVDSFLWRTARITTYRIQRALGVFLWKLKNKTKILWLLVGAAPPSSTLQHLRGVTRHSMREVGCFRERV